MAAALALDPSDIGERPLWVKAGKEQLVVPLTSTAAGQRAAPDAARLSDIRSEDGHCMAYVFSFEGPRNTLARFFFSQSTAMVEDPATGKPEWATVSSGLFGTKSNFVPLAGASTSGEDVRASVTKSAACKSVSVSASVSVAGS